MASRMSAPGGGAAGRQAGAIGGVGRGRWPRRIGCVRAAAFARMRVTARPGGGVGLFAEAAQDVVGAAGELAGSSGGPGDGEPIDAAADRGRTHAPHARGTSR
jgi:hypothetical protein